MATPFMSEIRMFGFDYAPRNWAPCSGQILPISQNQALFSLLGTTYGGDGQTTFGLPNLQGRVPVHFGQGQGLSPRNLGDVYGEENHTLTVNEIPSHSHVPEADSNNATSPSPVDNVWAKQPDGYLPYAATGGAPMRAGLIGNTGNGQPHPNQQPYLVVNFCIALQGIFPSRN